MCVISFRAVSTARSTTRWSCHPELQLSGHPFPVSTARHLHTAYGS
jgi:hypothetical protein